MKKFEFTVERKDIAKLSQYLESNHIAPGDAFLQMVTLSCEILMVNRGSLEDLLISVSAIWNSLNDGWQEIIEGDE